MLAPYVAQFRGDAEERMVDEYSFGVSTGGMTYDPETQTEVEDLTPLFTTKGYIPPAQGTNLSRSSEVGGRTVVDVTREIRIPWDSDEIPPGAIAICTKIGPETPPRMLNKRYRVGGSSGASQGTACHVEIMETLS